MVKYNGEANFKKLILEEFEGCPICLGDESENATRVSLEYKASIDGFLEAAQQFNEDFKEEIEKEKKGIFKETGNVYIESITKGGCMATYVISDVHGNYEGYMKILELINFSDADTLYVNGDVIDRGMGGIKILQHMMMQPNIYPILGNHEYAAGTCLRFLMKEITEESIGDIDEETIKNLMEWQNIGGQRTMDAFHKLSREEKQDIVDYLDEFSLYEEVIVNGTQFVIVHAGLTNFSADRPLDDYEMYELIFKAPFYDTVYFQDKYLVTGHLPTKAIEENPRPNKIFIHNNHIAIDCASGYDGCVGCICLDTFEEFYSTEEE